ncbi:VWA domain-containing protein, partial [Akkermansiaceae bacterium]|nr:VWA domain-containing protein [Akkermansiaceae bacterium]
MLHFGLLEGVDTLKSVTEIRNITGAEKITARDGGDLDQGFFVIFLLRRIDAAREVLLNFIAQRPDDRIGLVTFSGRPYTVAPLTLEHEILKLKISEIILVSGNREEGGTAIGSA